MPKPVYESLWLIYDPYNPVETCEFLLDELPNDVDDGLAVIELRIPVKQRPKEKLTTKVITVK